LWSDEYDDCTDSVGVFPDGRYKQVKSCDSLVFDGVTFGAVSKKEGLRCTQRTLYVKHHAYKKRGSYRLLDWLWLTVKQ
jgi:hypothetical protein